MKHYDRILLINLVESYERSQLYLKGDNINRRVYFRFNRKSLPDYFSDETSEYESINRACQVLEEKGFIDIKWQQNKVDYMIEKVSLNRERLDDIYGYLKRKPKREQENSYLSCLEKHKGKHSILDHFIFYIESRLEKNLSINQYVDAKDEKSLEQILIALEGILNNTNECYMRELSMKLFHNSKVLESMAGKLSTIIMNFDEANKELHDKESILAEYNIFNNPSYVMLKGCGKLQLGDSQIALEDIPYGIGINSKDLERLKIILSAEVKKVITIENLTVFNRYEEKNTLCVYLGGYHNRARRKLLLNLFDHYPMMKFYHWGDIDGGGFRIFRDLVEKTQIAFIPLNMDIDCLKGYQEYGKQLTINDKKTLEEMLKEASFQQFHEVIHYMLRHNIKLEQEIIAYEERGTIH